MAEGRRSELVQFNQPSSSTCLSVPSNLSTRGNPNILFWTGPKSTGNSQRTYHGLKPAYVLAMIQQEGRHGMPLYFRNGVYLVETVNLPIIRQSRYFTPSEDGSMKMTPFPGYTFTMTAEEVDLMRI